MAFNVLLGAATNTDIISIFTQSTRNVKRSNTLSLGLVLLEILDAHEFTIFVLLLHNWFVEILGSSNPPAQKIDILEL
jgi:hypothetical protein